MVFNIVFNTIAPTVSYALTSGPSQPEVQSFTPVGTSDMVTPFTGDFNYNIPLMDVGGYPLNVAYSAGISTDQEASWVGLGWNMNVGALNRSVRGIPDDFNGGEDRIEKQYNVKPNTTYGINASLSGEFFSIDSDLISASASVGLGFSYNNYNGYGFDFSLNPSFNAGEGGKNKNTAGLGVDLTASSNSGLGIKPSVSFQARNEDKDKGEYDAIQSSSSYSVGLGFNSRAGLQALSFQTNRSKVDVKKNEDGDVTGGESIGSNNGNASISFATPSYTPHLNMPMQSFGGTLNGTIGVEISGLHGNVRLSAYVSSQFLRDNTKQHPAYGYLYSHNSTGRNAMMDFNREKDNGHVKNNPLFPLTNFTYDVYNASGQGMSGTYRPFRNDHGIVHDPVVSNSGGNFTLPGIEFGGGNGFHVGTNFKALMTQDRTGGKWGTSGNVKSKLAFQAQKEDDPLYEPVHFKQAGEKNTMNNPEFFEDNGGFNATRVQLNDNAAAASANDRFQKRVPGEGMQTFGIDSENQRDKRVSRNQAITMLTAREAEQFGLEKNIKIYETNNFEMDEKGRYQHSDTIARTRYPDHHISQITVLRPDGTRYVYGIPVYNNQKKEVSFAVEGHENCRTGLMTYTPGEDNTVNNEQGIDHYFNSVETPEYAYTYLLTAVLSPDYTDITGDGPSDDDLGNYTKFNYTRAVENYKWRTPYREDAANHNPAINFYEDDDKASYVYGNKDIWYAHSIETRTHVAEFRVSEREDALEVKDENGGNNSNARSMYKLDRISLYARPDRQSEIGTDATASGHEATPIKTAHFEYDYSLCQGIPNNSNGGGKLTLQKLYFSYGNSEKAKLSPYEFNYGFNPDYNEKAYDRWGNYKPNHVSGGECGDHELTNSEYPYVNQRDENTVDRYAAAWSLQEIQLPSGGKIQLEFEADDYAYVQDRHAMQMFKITGTGTSPDADPTVNRGLMEPHNNSSGPDDQGNRYMFFRLAEPVSRDSGQTRADEIVREKYIRDILDNDEELYFKIYMDIDGQDAWHYVKGYSGIDQAGVATTGDEPGVYTHGYVSFDLIGIRTKGGGEEINHPVSKFGWEFVKKRTPKLAYGRKTNTSLQTDNSAQGAFDAIISAFGSVTDFLGGINRSLRNDDFCKEFDKNKSMIRLYNPAGKKLGGGLRVKRLEVTDEWDQMNVSGHARGASYGQLYDYETEGESGNMISSGVAAYEPTLGNDENPFRKRIVFDQDKRWVPDEEAYVELPYGESFFPSPVVGYRKVTVRNLNNDQVQAHGTGRVVHEFYTAKDFPVVTKKTHPRTENFKPNLVSRILKIASNHKLTASQGYKIELNDMHGKRRSKLVYQEGSDEPISGNKHFYHTQPDNDQRLSNKVPVIYKNQETAPGGDMVHEAYVGVDFDVVTDMNESRSTTTGSGLGGNLDAFMATILPVAVPMALPRQESSETLFRSVVTTKVIKRYGLVDSVQAFDQGSKVSTHNRLYDAETGEVLLTETQNQFDDPVYSFTFPAHWGYEQMGGAYRNAGLEMEVSTGADLDDYFTRGDVLGIRSEGTKAWVTHTQPLQLIDSGGDPVILNQEKVKVLRSGRRNMQTSEIGSITSLSNPLEDTDGDGAFDAVDLNDLQVLNASAVEFSDDWDVPCNCGFDPSQTFNEYFRGAKGNWRAEKSYAYLTERTQTRTNNAVDTRHEGVFEDFQAFWNKPVQHAGDWQINSEQWTFTTEVTEFSPYGFELENRDALGRHSAAMYGYNHTLPTAVANNARYQETAFDNFEDYGYDNCEEDHFSFRHQRDNVSGEESHSGRRSIKIGEGESVRLRKVIRDCPDDEDEDDNQNNQIP